MFGKGRPEALVIGAGPVGLFAAFSLARRGVRVQIVDKEWRTGAHSYALALHSHSLKLLEEYDLLGNLLDRAHRVRSIGLYDGAARQAEMLLSEQGEDTASLAVLRQDAFERLLEDGLRDLGVNVLWNHEVSQLTQRKDSVVATIHKMEKDSVGYATAHTEWVVAKSTQLEAPFVIGADGHRSLVRRLLGIDFAEAGPPQNFAVFEFKPDAGATHEMRIVLGDRTTDALWPMPNGHCRWSFELADFSAPEGSRMKDRIVVNVGRAQFPILSERSLQSLIADRAPWFDGKIEAINWRIAVRFERRLANEFGKGRLWLAGDAGHMTGPVGMQSMNVGLREANDLAEIIAGVLHNGESMERLEAYNRQRLAEWRFLLGFNGGLRSSAETDPWIAQRSDRLLSCIPASRADLAALARQIGLDTP